MSIIATVENGMIKLPDGVHFPDGSQVRLELLEPSKPRLTAAQVDDWLDRSVGVSNTGLTTDEIMKMWRGDDWGKP